MAQPIPAKHLTSGVIRFALAPAVSLCLMASGPSAHADDDDVSALWRDAETRTQARYRFEHVDQQGFDRNAIASTVRLRIGLRTGTYRGLTFLVEGEGTALLGANNFNSTQNGFTNFPVVPDPEQVELNRAQVQAKLSEQVQLTIGRQKIAFGNERFVGNVDFRQDDQTFDAIRFDAQPHDRMNITIAGGNRVNRIFGNENVATPPPQTGSFTGSYVLGNVTGEITDTIDGEIYGLWLDFEESPNESTRTIGIRLNGNHDVGGGIVLGWTGEYAYQNETAENPLDIDLFYALAEGRVKTLVGTLNGGVEVLDGNGTVGFSTPLSTLHKFNGTADVFLVTPAVGLRDAFIGWTSELPGLGPVRQMKANVTWHDFSSDNGSDDLGQEIDAELVAIVNKNVGTGLKFAKYGGGDAMAPPNTTRFWFTLDLKY